MTFDNQAGGGVQSGNSPVRRYPRSLFSVPVTLRHLVTGGIQTTRGISLDISKGGMGALVQGELLVGETVEIDLQLHQQPLQTVAIVRHSSSTRSGFEFVGLTPDEQSRIGNLLGNC